MNSSFLKQRILEVQEPAFAAQTAGPLVASFVYLGPERLGGLVFVPGETVSLRCMFGLFWFDGISNYDKFIIK